LIKVLVGTACEQKLLKAAEEWNADLRGLDAEDRGFFLIGFVTHPGPAIRKVRHLSEFLPELETVAITELLSY
jgi:hypothetical protein